MGCTAVGTERKNLSMSTTFDFPSSSCPHLIINQFNLSIYPHIIINQLLHLEIVSVDRIIVRRRILKSKSFYSTFCSFITSTYSSFHSILLSIQNLICHLHSVLKIRSSPLSAFAPFRIPTQVIIRIW